MFEKQLQELLLRAVRACQEQGVFPGELELPEIVLELPRNPEHGDLATNLALLLARRVRMSPKVVAEQLIEALPTAKEVMMVEVAGAGFINFKIDPASYVRSLRRIVDAGKTFGTSNEFAGKSCQVEFVSANPTGPLHIGHGRGVVLGDTISSLLSAVGYDVTREYYVNDAGVQMRNLGRSVLLRVRELQGEKITLSDECYRGKYLIPIAQRFIDEGHEERYSAMSQPEAEQECGRYAGRIILDSIKQELDDCGVSIDNYFFETTLHESNAVELTIKALEAAGHVYENGGALWFRSSTFGDDKDRVLRKSDGSFTYFIADVAYHLNKFRRGFVRVVDVFGADHAGHVPRMKAAVEALGYGDRAFDCVLVQIVNLIRDGCSVNMSTRRGEFEPLADLIKTVGRDVTRYFFLMRSHNAQLDFDLQLATAKTMDNPVYYIQYAHARICSIFARVAAAGLRFDPAATLDSQQLTLPEEQRIIRFLWEYPKVVNLAARELEPHRIPTYLLELARIFQSYYTVGKRDSRYRVLDQPPATMHAKLTLLQAVKIVLANGLGLLGLSIPERMDRETDEVDDG